MMDVIFVREMMNDALNLYLHNSYPAAHFKPIKTRAFICMGINKIHYDSAGIYGFEGQADDRTSEIIGSLVFPGTYIDESVRGLFREKIVVDDSEVRHVFDATGAKVYEYIGVDESYFSGFEVGSSAVHGAAFLEILYKKKSRKMARSSFYKISKGYG